MSILKVEVGKPLTATIVEYMEVEGQYGPQVKFETEVGDVIFVSKDAADRQLERIGNPQPPITLLFEKVQKGNKTYLNINPAKQNGNGGGVKSAGDAGASRSVVAPQSAASAPARQQPAPSSVTRAQVSEALDLEEVPGLALYKACLRGAREALEAELEAFDAENIVAAAATLYIQANRR